MPTPPKVLTINYFNTDLHVTGLNESWHMHAVLVVGANIQLRLYQAKILITSCGDHFALCLSLT